MVADGNGTQILTLPTLRLSAVDKVRIDDRLIDSGSYRWRSRGQLLYRHGWPEGMGNVEVDITHGYEETPDAVKAVVLALAAAMVDNPAGRVMAVVGAVTSQYGINLTTLQLAQLAGYTLP